MRKLTENERTLIEHLLIFAECDYSNLDQVIVNVINEYTSTIRSTHLGLHERIESVSDTNFKDMDGVHVEVILFVDKKRQFAELLIWKVDDTRLHRLPSSLSEYGTSTKL